MDSGGLDKDGVGFVDIDETPPTLAGITRDWDGFEVRDLYTYTDNARTWVAEFWEAFDDELAKMLRNSQVKVSVKGRMTQKVGSEIVWLAPKGTRDLTTRFYARRPYPTEYLVRMDFLDCYASSQRDWTLNPVKHPDDIYNVIQILFEKLAVY